MPTEDRPSRFPPFGEVLDPDAATSAERQAIRLARSMDTGTLQRKMREFAGKREVRPSEIREMGAVSLVYARRMSAAPTERPMTTDEWITHIDAERERRSGSTDNAPLAAGDWHAYGNSFSSGNSPMHGRYVLVRWADPTVAVSHDDPEEAKRLARLLEAALEPGATALRAVTALQEGGLLITPAEKSVACDLVKEALGG